jgi:ribulose-5-phosphate 4-epimerase/fuculose-1-phosphate aldolase
MSTTVPTDLPFTLLAARDRCARQGFLTAAHAGISLRLPGVPEFLFLDATATLPRLESTRTPSNHPLIPLHAGLYQLRPDVGAILVGGGTFAASLHDLGTAMPVAFDEQARHLGRMGRAAPDMTTRELQTTFANGANTALVGDLPVCLGTTCQRLVLNAELFEKCAKAYALAAATGQPVSTLPWWVCAIAIGRLRKDQRHAAERFAQGLLPQEARGY